MDDTVISISDEEAKKLMDDSITCWTRRIMLKGMSVKEMVELGLTNREWCLKKDYMSRGSRHLILRELTGEDDNGEQVESPEIDDVNLEGVLMIVAMVIFTVVIFSIVTALIIGAIDSFA